ncbi:general secretion pathway protein E [Myxococcus stipitatus DSM 14675]|uniref:General secretion pathway protein E n=1 Tax=Myxococcus stipitatus (strain DSM 14675 / JCM 12634 / Mx s8) TaxID=1278073 RepID=L7U278_MYXSD|nr:ATPase, T2SS/T4P/T4SS family [Myxococcus stipitatus]AGC41910.1 general secretion pathway protein E [Myxococcus stipitatus DSM 14675]
MSIRATTPAELISGLLEHFSTEGIPVPAPPPPPASPLEAAAALFSLAAQTHANLFSVWSDVEVEETVSGTSFFLLRPDAPEHSGLLGQDKQAVRQPLTPELFAVMRQALATFTQRGHDARRPARGTVTSLPEVHFWVTFEERPGSTTLAAHARDAKLRAAQPPFSALENLGAPEAAFLTEQFLRLDTLFQGRPVVFSGERGSGRSTSLHAALEALPDFTNTLAALDLPRAVDTRFGTVRVGDGTTLAQALRAFLRQDPDVVVADEPRTAEDLQLLLRSNLTGHATVFTLEASNPEAALAKLREALPEAPVAPLIVHHTRDGSTGKTERSLHAVTQEGTVQAWSS